MPGDRDGHHRQRCEPRRGWRTRHAADRPGSGERPVHPHWPAAAQPAAEAHLIRRSPMTTLTINRKPVEVQAEPDTPLLWVLRGELQMTGTKFGCGVAQCGACTVHVDGEPTRS